MKCTECSYEHNSNTENWVYLGDASYEIKSNLFDNQLLIEIVEHAFSLDTQPKGIYIDTWLINCLSCSLCSLQNIRNKVKRSELEREYDRRGFNIYYYF